MQHKLIPAICLLMTLALTERFFHPLRIMVTTLLVGLALALGVADLDDKCPNSTPGSRVDTNGCPMDDDKDDVIDTQDYFKGRKG